METKKQPEWQKISSNEPMIIIKIMDEDLDRRETTEEENGIVCGTSAKTSGHQCKARQETIFAFGKRFPSRQVQAFPNYFSSAAAGPPLSSVFGFLFRNAIPGSE